MKKSNKTIRVLATLWPVAAGFCLRGAVDAKDWWLIGLWVYFTVSLLIERWEDLEEEGT